MINVTKPLAVLGVACAMALAAAAPSEARSGRNAAAIGAGVAGFAVGAAVGAAAANANRGYYHGGYYAAPAYGYYGEPGYAYSEPAYVDSYAYAPRRQYHGGDPSSYYAPYATRSTWPNDNPRERALRGTDY